VLQVEGFAPNLFDTTAFIYYIEPHGQHGYNSLAVQAARVYFSVERDLRGHRLLLDYGPLGVELKNNIKCVWWLVKQKRGFYSMQDALGLR